jgi:tetratricopeptide (TPR) repeat protein
MDRFDWLEFDTGVGESQKKRGPALRTQPTDGPSYYRAAREMRQAGHFKAAADYYRKSISFDDHHYAAWVELVDTLVRAQRIEDADRVSDEALRAYRQVRPLYAARALVLAHRGKFDEAYPLAQVSVEGGDRSWYSRCVFGELMLRTNAAQRAEALDRFEEAMDLADGHWEAPFLAGLPLLDAKLPALAAGYFSEAARAKPLAPICWLCLGDAFRDLKLFDQALFYYQRVVELEPSNEIALQRQKDTSPLLYGLTRVFRRDSLKRRWQREFEKLASGRERDKL